MCKVSILMVPQRCLCPLPTASEYVTLRGKRDFAGITKATDLKREDDLILSSRAHLITQAFKSREPLLAATRYHRRGNSERFKI